MWPTGRSSQRSLVNSKKYNSNIYSHFVSHSRGVWASRRKFQIDDVILLKPTSRLWLVGKHALVPENWIQSAYLLRIQGTSFWAFFRFIFHTGHFLWPPFHRESKNMNNNNLIWVSDKNSSFPLSKDIIKQ